MSPNSMRCSYSYLKLLIFRGSNGVPAHNWKWSKIPGDGSLWGGGFRSHGGPPWQKVLITWRPKPLQPTPEPSAPFPAVSPYRLLFSLISSTRKQTVQLSENLYLPNPAGVFVALTGLGCLSFCSVFFPLDCPYLDWHYCGLLTLSWVLPVRSDATYW